MGHRTDRPDLTAADGFDRLFAGKLILAQPAAGHRAGTDAVLLAAAIPHDARVIADLGSASGVVGLRAAQINPAAQVTLIERDADLVAMAKTNIAANGLESRVLARRADAFKLGRETDLREAFDCVATNPPFLDAASARVSANRNRARAHVMEGTFVDWIKGAVTILAPKGRLVMIHRADQLAEILVAMKGRLGGISLRFIHAEADGAAIRVLVQGRKGSRAPVGVLPALVLNARGGFTSVSQALHAGDVRLDMETGGKSRP